MRRLVILSAVVAAAACAAVGAARPAGTPTPLLAFKLFIDPNLPKLGQVVWTGRSFVYISELNGTLKSSDPQGKTASPYATFDQGGEEMRCAPSPGGRWMTGIFCHTADNRIVNVSLDGTKVTPFAQLPATAGPESDGSIVFDHVGKFGRRMLVSSGGSFTNGGNIYAISTAGDVSLIGSYPGPGAADNIVVAPPKFGAIGGSVLIARDQTGVTGSVVAMNRRGVVQTLAAGLGNGINTIQVLVPQPRRRSPNSAAPGLYFGDQASGNVYFAPAAPLRRFSGDVLIGGEEHAWFWVLRPQGKKFQVLRLRTNLASKKWTLEGAAYVP